MQSLVQAVIARVSADAVLAGLAGQAATSVYLGRAPEGAALPFIILQTAAAAATAHDFPGSRLTHVTLHITCVAGSLALAFSMAQRVVVLLDQSLLPLASGTMLGAAELYPPQPQLAGTGAAGAEIYRVRGGFDFTVFTAPGS